MVRSTPSPDAFGFNSGSLCLDFANTVRARPISDRIEAIHSYGDLLSWAREATILTPGETAALAEDAERRPRLAAQALAQALAVREAIYALFSSHCAGLPAPPADLQTLNRAIGVAMAKSGLTLVGERFEWAWPGAHPSLDRVSWWVARSAAELLTSENLTSVR